jgi:sulfite exporter TauE/SafE
MLDAALIASAGLMGLAGTPHCALMCSAPCAAICGRAKQRRRALLAGRLLSYTLAGALVAASVQVLGLIAKPGGALQPLWALAHAALLVLGLSLLLKGRQPAWLDAMGTRVSARTPWAAGLAWVAWPCGLLQSALLVAALTTSPLSGALAMAGFAASSSLGLLLAPAVLARLPQRWAGPSQAVRLAGLGLCMASGWALAHGVWEQVRLVC